MTLNLKDKFDLCNSIADKFQRARCRISLEREIVREGLKAELDAVSLYETLALMTKKPQVRKVVEDIAREEKAHIGEFLALLVMLDDEQMDGIKKGKKEVEDVYGR